MRISHFHILAILFSQTATIIKKLCKCDLIFRLTTLWFDQLVFWEMKKNLFMSHVIWFFSMTIPSFHKHFYSFNHIYKFWKENLVCMYFRAYGFVITSESPKRIVTTVYNLYCSYYPFKWLMPCPFTSPKMFCAGPNFLCQTKNLFTYYGSHKKMICIQ